jgi:hypothetical protein
MAVDPFVAEVRRAREALAARYNFDLRAMMEDIRRRQAEGGRKVVRLPPKLVRKIVRIETPGEQRAHETASS